MANYVARFIPNFATISEPLRTLTHKNTTWKWTEKIKNKNNFTENVAYYNPNQPSELVVDAGPVGLGCLLTQKDSKNNITVIAYKPCPDTS